MMNQDQIEQVLGSIHYLNRAFRVSEYMGVLYFQVIWRGTDSETGLEAEQRSRKWQLSYHMTRSEIVQTALKAVLTAEEHEVRENFRYRGKAIFGPHFDVDELVNMMPEQDVRK
jgi:hypothetical protein